MIPALQYLRHGKALCGKVFKRFVETFNFHNDFIANLKGDGDIPGADGHITFDRTDPTHPVIRLNTMGLGEVGAMTGVRKAWDYVQPVYNMETGEIIVPGYFYEPYVYVGTRLYRYGGDFGRHGMNNGFVYVSVSLSGTAPTINVNLANSAEDVQRSVSEGESVSATILLYQTVNWEIVCDFRTIPAIPAWEYGQ